MSRLVARFTQSVQAQRRAEEAERQRILVEEPAREAARTRRRAARRFGRARTILSGLGGDGLTEDSVRKTLLGV